MQYSLGIDIGTSGIRAIVMDEQQHICAHSHISSESSNPHHWWASFEQLIFKLKRQLFNSQSVRLSAITHLAIDGTSASVLLSNQNGEPCTEALMYNDQRAIEYAHLIDEVAPDNTAARGASSGLAKLLWLFHHHRKLPGKNQPYADTISYALNQADWLAGKLCQLFGFSDYNNALKMGYDPTSKSWPEWLDDFLKQQGIPVTLLPRVYSPGQVITIIDKKKAEYFGFSPQLKICAGTTDSTAAIIASGAKTCGDAVTSLGSSLVMKLISEQAVYDTQSGVYSQPYGDLWLVGGASNSGGAVLKHYFSTSQIEQFSDSLNCALEKKQLRSLDLNYYPLLSAGERFPIQNHLLAPRLLPRPESDLNFFQAMLEGMADIETLAYQRLLELGVAYPKHVISIGGGASNQAWHAIRQDKLGIPLKKAAFEQAAAGSAILAQSTW